MVETYAIERMPRATYAVRVATLGQNIRRLRERPGFKKSRRDLAKAIGTEYQAVYDWEKDRRRTVDSKTLLKLARGLEATVEQLLDGVDEDYETVKRDLIGQNRDQPSGLPPPGGPHVGVVAIETRLHQLEQDNARLRSALDQVTDVASDLLQIAAEHRAAEESGGPDRTESRTRRRAQ